MIAQSCWIFTVSLTPPRCETVPIYRWYSNWRRFPWKGGRSRSNMGSITLRRNWNFAWKMSRTKERNKIFQYLVDAGSGSSSSRHFKGIRRNKSAPIKEWIRRVNENCRISETTHTWIFYHCLYKWLCVMLCCVTFQTLDKNKHRHFLNF